MVRGLCFDGLWQRSGEEWRGGESRDAGDEGRGSRKLSQVIREGVVGNGLSERCVAGS